MAIGHSILCATACFTAVGFGRSIPSKSMWACRRNGSSGFWTGLWPGVGILVSCVWTMVQNLSLRLWPTERKSILSNWNLSSRVSQRSILISNDSTVPIAMRCSIGMSLKPCRKCGSSRKNGSIQRKAPTRYARRSHTLSNIDEHIKHSKTLI